MNAGSNRGRRAIWVVAGLLAAGVVPAERLAAAPLPPALGGPAVCALPGAQVGMPPPVALTCQLTCKNNVGGSIPTQDATAATCSQAQSEVSAEILAFANQWCDEDGLQGACNVQPTVIQCETVAGGIEAYGSGTFNCVGCLR